MWYYGVYSRHFLETIVEDAHEWYKKLHLHSQTKARTMLLMGMDRSNANHWYEKGVPFGNLSLIQSTYLYLLSDADIALYGKQLNAHAPYFPSLDYLRAKASERAAEEIGVTLKQKSENETFEFKIEHFWWLYVVMSDEGYETAQLQKCFGNNEAISKYFDKCRESVEKLLPSKATLDKEALELLVGEWWRRAMAIPISETVSKKRRKKQDGLS